jgi:hypothetical protein
LAGFVLFFELTAANFAATSKGTQILTLTTAQVSEMAPLKGIQVSTRHSHKDIRDEQVLY